MPHHDVAHSRRRLDMASLALLVVGLVSAAVSCWLIATRGASALILLPAALAIMTGSKHLTKHVAVREQNPDYRAR